MTVLIATSTTDFDPSEVAIPWKALRDAGVEVYFATDTGKTGAADPIMLSGKGLGFFKGSLIAGKAAQAAYKELLSDNNFQNPISYDAIKVENYSGIILPGGHAQGMLPYLENKTLQSVIVGFFAADKPVGAICHGVVAVCRALKPDTGKSVLWGRKTTSLQNRQELLAHKLTKRKMGDYFLTYPDITVEDEVRASLASPDDFITGPNPMFRDSAKNLKPGFTVRDGNYLSARWPGDAYSFANEFLQMIREYEAK
ncbi:MAG: type 1 glutamine amidotransferase domain-containing protein [Robiginitomaculum sp.]|nr:type 1 glutamine amidotransferase domain-containing protein [Robiginitomaculum sp.]